jgi:Aspartyl/Asparaginyl beta-hydroxylase
MRDGGDVPPVRFCRLPLRFDASALQADLAALRAGDWAAHFNLGYHDGGWTGIGLRAVGGDPRALFPPSDALYQDTPLLARCPAIRTALTEIQAPLQSVRLLRLAAGSVIREHRDDRLSLAEGSARLHVPIATNPEVEFYLEGVRLAMAEGECWYVDFSLPHRVQNLGAADRVHLVIDCAVNDWLLAEIAAAAPAPPSPEGSQARLLRFCRVVLGDAALQERLRRETDPAAFVALVLALGREGGQRFTEEDVRALMQANRRAQQARGAL